MTTILQVYDAVKSAQQNQLSIVVDYQLFDHRLDVVCFKTFDGTNNGQFNEAYIDDKTNNIIVNVYCSTDDEHSQLYYNSVQAFEDSLIYEQV